MLTRPGFFGGCKKRAYWRINENLLARSLVTDESDNNSRGGIMFKNRENKLFMCLKVQDKLHNERLRLIYSKYISSTLVTLGSMLLNSNNSFFQSFSILAAFRFCLFLSTSEFTFS